MTLRAGTGASSGNPEENEVESGKMLSWSTSTSSEALIRVVTYILAGFLACFIFAGNLPLHIRSDLKALPAGTSSPTESYGSVYQLHEVALLRHFPSPRPFPFMSMEIYRPGLYGRRKSTLSLSWSHR